MSTDKDAIDVRNIVDQADRVNIRIDGLVQARTNGSGVYVGPTEAEDFVRIVVGKTGSVISGGEALNFGSSNYGGGEVVNHGTIIGRDGIIVGEGDTYDITNTGAIID